jgi:hypothetical protein
MTKLIKGTLIRLVLLVVITTPSWGLNGAKLLGLSKSGQTALFNLGSHDAAKEGDYAVIVKEIRSLDSRDLRIVPVARARNIKMSSNNSVWILFKLYDPELLVKDQSYLILSESTMLSGRRDPRFNRLSVVTEKNKTAFQTNQTLSSDKDRLSKLKDQYPAMTDIHDKEERHDSDGELVDVEGWKRIKNSKYRTALYKSPNVKDFQRQLRLSTFEKMVTAYLKKVNAPDFNYDKFYYEQKKSEFSNEFRERSNFSTEYEKFLSSQGQKAVADAKLYRSILEKGSSWSEDFSDEELKRVLSEVSMLQEKDRRTFIMVDPNRYALYLNYGMEFTDAQTEKDSGYRRDGRYSLELEFEGIPVIKHETLQRFTLDALFRTNKTAFEAGNKNARLDELSVGGGFNWYPLYYPYVQEAAVIFLGAYFRSGTANAQAVSIAEKANYTLLVMPGLRGGMRYNFKNNVGIRLALSMETLKLDRYQQSKFGSVLPNQVNLVEGKMNFSLLYAF